MVKIKVKNAIIGGTGVYEVDQMATKNVSKTVKTEYGEVTLDIKTIEGEDIIFLPRHGVDHSIPPHEINYRANMKALKDLGVSNIFATTAVGSCHEEYAPGDLVIVEDFIDFTKNRNYTYFDEKVKHIDMSEPYCSNMNELLRNKFSKKDISYLNNGIYGCFEGPRFETSAEIKMANLLGANIVGMTNIPESILAAELKMCYSNVSIIVNWGTGFKDEDDITKEYIQNVIKKNKNKLIKVFIEIFKEKIININNCNCNNPFIV